MKSYLMTLNPEIIPKAVEIVKASSALASQDVKFYASIDKNLEACFQSSASSLLSIANNLMLSCIKDHNGEALSESPASFSWKPIENVLDSIFESLDYLMDDLKSLKKETPRFITLDDDNDMDLKFNSIEKPKIKFPLDNFDSAPFQPKLKFKPNALIPLAESLQSKDLPVGYNLQPYSHEIMQNIYPKWLYETQEPTLSTSWASTLAIWVNDQATLLLMIERLKLLKDIAVDLEHHDYHSYYGLTCLMQISNREQDWIIDTIALREELIELNIIFTDPNIVKVFHGASMDIIWLQRDLGLYVVSLFDTYHASKALGFPKFSLAYLLETFANFKTSKKYQLADWRIRPLPKQLTDYARADTHFLLNIFDQLRSLLLSGDNSKLETVLNNSRLVACRRFEYKKFRINSEDWSSFEERDLEARIISQNNIPESIRPIARNILQLRDDIARELDESTRFILPNQTFLNLSALSVPVTTETIKSTLGRSFSHFKNHMETLSGFFDAPVSREPNSDVYLKSTDSNARHFSELFSKNVQWSISQSRDHLCKDSRHLPNLSNYNGSLLPCPSGNLTEIQISFEEFNPGINMNIKADADIQSSDDSGQLLPPDMAEVEVDEPLEILKPLKRRSVVSYKGDKKRQGDKIAFNYDEADKEVLHAQPMVNSKKRSYEPFLQRGAPLNKKPKARKGFQTGKSVSFSGNGNK